MSNAVISVENLSKAYRLGQIGTGTFANDLKLWWAKMRGKPNPLLKIGGILFAWSVAAGFISLVVWAMAYKS